MDLLRSRLGSYALHDLPRWSNMRPLLLGSVGVVGLAAVVSNESLFVKPEKSEFVEAARPLVPDDSITPRAVATISVRADTAYGNFVPGGFAPPPTVRGDAKGLVVPAAPE